MLNLDTRWNLKSFLSLNSSRTLLSSSSLHSHLPPMFTFVSSLFHFHPHASPQYHLHHPLPSSFTIALSLSITFTILYHHPLPSPFPSLAYAGRRPPLYLGGELGNGPARSSLANPAFQKWLPDTMVAFAGPKPLLQDISSIPRFRPSTVT